jgi:hypothetical protein
VESKDKIKELILEDLKKAPIVQLACERVGIARATFYRMKKSDKKFATAVDESIIEGRLVVNDLAESRLMAAIQSGNLTSVMYWLNHNHGQYSNKLEITGKLTTKSELSAEQEADIKRALSLIDFKEVPSGK